MEIDQKHRHRIYMWIAYIEGKDSEKVPALLGTKDIFTRFKIYLDPITLELHLTEC